MYEIFSKYGIVNKILIFERGKITKVFIEMNDKEIANTIQKNLDNTMIMNNKYKINIYFSKNQNLDL